MKQYEKLDFLMTISNLSNSRAGREIKVDNSYISLIRNGKRRLPQDPDFIAPLCALLARSLTEPRQREVLERVLCPGQDWPSNPPAAAQLIASWLSIEDKAVRGSLNQILSTISNMPIRQPSRAAMEPLPSMELPTVSFHYGNEGKRQAVELFLSDLCTLVSPPLLLLYSSEEFDWLYEDPAFARRWAALMMKFIAQGGKIKIIHTISRNASEMLVALQKWMPLYMGGAIEPYYYTKLRDRVARRTLFIAQGRSALTSNSIGKETEGALNTLLYDQSAVKALELEFTRYLSMCSPLMDIFTAEQRESFCQNLRVFEEDETELLMALPVPSLAAMSAEMAERMSRRAGEWLLRRWEVCRQGFERQLALGQPIVDILHLPSPQTVREGKLNFPMSDFFGGEQICYTAEEFAGHLRAAIALLREHAAYQVILAQDIPENMLLCVKDNLGAIVVKANPPSIAFAISEPRMVSAFWGYLYGIADANENKPHTIKMLEHYLRKLEE